MATHGRSEMQLAGNSTLNAARTGPQVALAAGGDWTAEHAAELDGLVGAALGGLDKSPVKLDLAGISHLDTYGAWLLERLASEARGRGCEIAIAGMPQRFKSLADAVHRAANSPTAKADAAPSRRSLGERAGDAFSGVVEDLGAFLHVLGAAGEALVRVVRHPSTLRLTSVVYQLDRVAWQAVPIVALITFLIGGIIAQQGFFHFRKFGADQYVVDMVGILVLREIGVLLVAIMVAGRSGSSYTAELGSMKMREEIDALRTMGLDPVAVLILPRLIALVLALPALTFIGCMAALYGGGLVAWLYGDMAPAIFIARLKEAISVTHFKVGMIKAPFMALAIGIVACSEGLRVKGSAESLGLRTTASVVKSIFLVIVLDGLFAIYFAAIGM